MSQAELLSRALALPGVERLAGLPGVHLVGGAVRDLLLDRPVGRDLDLVVDGELDRAIAALGGEQVARHDRFGTATIRRGGMRYDLARARTESYPRPGALPEVEWAPLERDLERRDFTVNAMALEPASGRLRAAERAREDLAARVLRVLHPRSFVDDPTRVLRLARYAARLGFSIEEETAKAARAASLETVSRERVDAELRLLAREPDPATALAVLADLGIPGPDPGVVRRALALLPPDGDREELILRAGEEVPELRGLDPDAVAARLRTPVQAALAGAQGAEAEARRWLEHTRHVGLAISGDDLRAAGIPSGPELGAALRVVLRRKRNGERFEGRDAELAAALTILRR